MGARNFTRSSCRLPLHGQPVKGARNFTRSSCRLCLPEKEVNEHDAPGNVLCTFVLDLLAIVPRPP